MSLQDIPPQHAFWISGGKSIKNIIELARELKQMTSGTFTHHVNDEKNDFANWVEYCVKDSQLATLLRTTKNRERMAAIVERRIQELTQPRPLVKTPRLKEAQPKKPEIRETPQPSIIRTKNVTLLNLAHEPTIVKTGNVTPLKLAPEDRKIIRTQKTTQLIVSAPKKIIKTPHTTPLKLGHEHPQKEIYIHEVKKHHSSILLISHLVLGLVIGVAIAALVIAFNT